MSDNTLTYGELVEQVLKDLKSAGSNKEARDQCIGRLNLIYANIRSRGTVMSGGGDMKKFEEVDNVTSSSGTAQEWTHSFASATNRYFFTPGQITIGEERIKRLNLQDKNMPPEKAAEMFIKAASDEARKSYDLMKKELEKHRQNKDGGIPAPFPRSGQLESPNISGGEDVATASPPARIPPSSSTGKNIT